MPFIYKIINNINGKCYIGKTLGSIEKRWQEHQHDRLDSRCKDRPLYRALNKYGIENFSIEQVEECDENILSEREQYWIKYYNSYHYGYNATLGGDGKQYIDYDLVVEAYSRLKNQILVAKELNICVDTVRRVLRIRKIPILTTSEILKDRRIKVNMYTLQGEYLRTFDSILDAGKFALKNSKSSSQNFKTSAQHVREVCNGKRNTAYGYLWRYANLDKN